MEPIAVSVEEAARLLGVSRGQIYPRVTSGEIPSFKIGGRRLLLVSAIQEWAEQELQKQR